MSNDLPLLRARLLQAADDLALTQSAWHLTIGAETLKAQQQHTIDVLRAAEARIRQLDAALRRVVSEASRIEHVNTASRIAALDAALKVAREALGATPEAGAQTPAKPT